MKVYLGFDDTRLKTRPRSVAVGIFDGVHRGHLRILRKLIADARRARRPALVVTFEPHPEKVLRPDQKHPILMSLAHRLRLFERLGIDEVVLVRFDRRFSQIAHETFLTEQLLGRAGARTLVVGHDFRFGHGGMGTLDYLRRNAPALGYRLYAVDAMRLGRTVISSTEIRRLISAGALRGAERMLGRPVSVYGDVIRGRGRGGRLGFPTANINPHHETLPPSGVYAVRGCLGRLALRGVMHLGVRPTFGESDPSVEVHFIDRKLSLYGKEIELEFVRKLRDIKHFPSVEALRKAIGRDVERARKLLF